MNNKWSVEKVFVYISLIFGFIMIFINPPFQSPDENSHFKRAYVVSKGDFYPTSKNGEMTFNLPVDMNNYISEKMKYASNRNKKYTYEEMYVDQLLSQNYDEKSYEYFSTVAVTPFAYIFPTLGIHFSSIFDETFITPDGVPSATYMLYFARIFNLLAYIIIVAISIKKIPIAKKTMCAIALLPMSIYLATSVSYDSLLLSLSFLFIANILELILDKKKMFNFKHAILFIIIGFYLFNVKIVYITLFSLLIFIPSNKYKDKKDMIKKLMLILFGILVLTILNKIPTMMLKDLQNGTETIDQIKYILKYPIDYLHILIDTVQKQFGFQLSTMIGVFGSLDTYLPVSMIIILTLFIIIVSIMELSYEKFVLNKKVKLLLFLSIIISFVGIYTAMYIVWTSKLTGFGIGAREITGVQGRYFIPLLLPTLLLFSNGKFSKNEKIKKLADFILDNIYLISIIGLIISTLVIVLRFWV